MSPHWGSGRGIYALLFEIVQDTSLLLVLVRVIGCEEGTMVLVVL